MAACTRGLVAILHFCGLHSEYRLATRKAASLVAMEAFNLHVSVERRGREREPPSILNPVPMDWGGSRFPFSSS